MKNTYKKLHKWPGLIMSFILLYYGITGVLLNHRELLSGIDISRNILPRNYGYDNWNNAALKGNLVISPDSVLVYGNIGIWLTDSAYTRYNSFNSGLPKGSDNHKIFDVYLDKNGDLFAAALFGLYAYDNKSSQWKEFELPVKNERFNGIEAVGDTLYVTSRSYLFKGKSEGTGTQFSCTQLPAPEGYVNRVSLFSTIWQIHSGEIFGLPGQLFVDILGIITIFLSVTGIIYFFFPGWLKRRNRKELPVERISRISRWTLKWHNKTGAWTFLLLIILFFTGIFLRPPLLLAIARAEIKPLKFSHLDQPNPWYDKLRDILYDDERNILLLSTTDGMYYTDPGRLKPVRFNNQPPLSIMGINSFYIMEKGSFMIGSFSGLFLWHPDHAEIWNYAAGEVYEEQQAGRPVGDYKISGTIKTPEGRIFMIDYDKGAIALSYGDVFPAMPSQILDVSKMSLWNVCLEIHTGRFFQNFLGNFYILIVPLAGLTGITVVLSGYLLWRKKYRKKSDFPRSSNN